MTRLKRALLCSLLVGGCSALAGAVFGAAGAVTAAAVATLCCHEDNMMPLPQSLRSIFGPPVASAPLPEGEPEWRIVELLHPSKAGWVVEQRDPGGEWRRVEAWSFYYMGGWLTDEPVSKDDALYTVKILKEEWQRQNVEPVRGEVVAL